VSKVMGFRAFKALAALAAERRGARPQTSTCYPGDWVRSRRLIHASARFPKYEAVLEVNA
jgi:hypothetical protein